MGFRFRICFLREKLHDLAYYWQCLENRPLERYVKILFIFDQFMSILLLFPTTAIEFLYVHPAGKSNLNGYISWFLNHHVDIYSFRRYQPEWELDPDQGYTQPIDTISWTDHLKYINSTRHKMDVKCSVYENGVAIPGDPGDYVKEVAGHPIISGYYGRLKLMVGLWTATIFIIYFTTPLVLIAVYYRKKRGEIVAAYIFLQCVPMVLLVAVSWLGNTQLMCALNVIFDWPIETTLIGITVCFWFYQLFKFLLVELYVIEMYLIRKRKGYGFSRKKGAGNRMEAPGAGVDVEKIIKEEEMMIQRNMAQESGESSSEVDRRRLARRLIDLGESTGEESEVKGRRTSETMRNAARRVTRLTSLRPGGVKVASVGSVKGKK